MGRYFTVAVGSKPLENWRRATQPAIMFDILPEFSMKELEHVRILRAPQPGRDAGYPLHLVS
jgi:hypothetical protein